MDTLLLYALKRFVVLFCDLILKYNYYVPKIISSAVRIAPVLAFK